MSHVSKPALGIVHIAQQVSTSRLRAHVERLAGEINERNRPGSARPHEILLIGAHYDS